MKQAINLLRIVLTHRTPFFNQPDCLTGNYPPTATPDDAASVMPGAVV